jgi:hypothetical protein
MSGWLSYLLGWNSSSDVAAVATSNNQVSEAKTDVKPGMDLLLEIKQFRSLRNLRKVDDRPLAPHRDDWLQHMRSRLRPVQQATRHEESEADEFAE